MKSIIDINVPQLGPNDLTVTIVDWEVTNYEYVEEEQHICTVESTKSTFEIKSEHKGYIKILADLGSEVSIEDTIAIIGEDKSEIKKRSYQNIKTDISNKKNIQSATKKALKKADELKIPINEIISDGIIKEDDVIKYFNSKNKVRSDSGTSQGIKKTIKLVGNSLEAKQLMISSKTEIPHSYIETELIVNPIESFLKHYIESKNYMTILPIVIKAVGESLIKHEYFNSYRANSEIRIYKDINIGIVIDLGDKLAVPIVKNVIGKSIDQILRDILEMRKGLLQNKIDYNNLVSGTFTISALDHTDVIRFYPIIHPGQAAVLGFPKSSHKLDINEGGEIIKNKVTNLGLSFDHSYLNASMAMNFLNTVVIEIENIISDKSQG